MNRSKYMKEYYKKNKKKLDEYTKEWRRNHPEEVKQYWKDNKEKLYQQNRKWQKANSKRFSQLCCESRRRRVEKLKAQGITNAWAVINGAEPKYKK